MKLSDGISKVEAMLSTNNIGLMKIDSASTYVVGEDWPKENGIAGPGEYHIITVQIAIPIAPCGSI